MVRRGTGAGFVLFLHRRDFPFRERIERPVPTRRWSARDRDDDDKHYARGTSIVPTVLETLFPNWSSPATIAALVALRVGCNGCLVAITARAAGVRTLVTGTVAGLTVFSAVAMVLVLRPGVLGYRASNLELLAQVALLLAASYAVYANPSTGLIVAAAVVLVAATALLLFTIPVYGEAFVAP